MYERWPDYFDRTASHKFRQGDDTAIPFMHANVAIEEFGAKTSNAVTGMYGTWTPRKADNNAYWNKVQNHVLLF